MCVCACLAEEHNSGPVSVGKHQVPRHLLRDVVPGILQHIFKLLDDLYRKSRTTNLTIRDIPKDAQLYLQLGVHTRNRELPIFSPMTKTLLIF